MGLSISREIAYSVYAQVIAKKCGPESILETHYSAAKKPLKRIDRNLAKELIYGSLRWHLKIKWILQNLASRDLDKVDPQILSVLVIGTYQIFYMERIPDRAAVNESVEYVRKIGMNSATSFVNGILRQVARRSAYFAKPDKEKYPVDYLALQFSHPKWMIQRWSKQFKFDQVEQMLIANNQAPPHYIRINTIKTPVEDVHKIQTQLLKDERTKTEKRPLRSSVKCVQFPMVADGSLFQQGYFTIQGESSQLISLLVDPKPGEFIIDAACGPGGKLTNIAELGKGDVHVIGVDINEGQVKKSRKAIARLGIGEFCEAQVGDFLEWTPPKKPQKILLDAPCSGLGVLRRHPDGKLSKDLTIIKRSMIKQRALIKKSIDMLEKGGELIYSVCSFEPEELLDHHEWISREYADQIEFKSPLPRVPNYYKKYCTKKNIFVIFSGNQDDLDGFSSFILEKK